MLAEGLGEVVLPSEGEAVDGTHLAVRPEKIVIHPPAGEDGWIRCAAKVVDTAYYGDVSQVFARVGDAGPVLSVALSNARRLAGDSLQAGDAVQLGWRAADCLLLSDELPASP
ncbi:MAG: TOBE domain-containing protein [Burkholderiaceae bacterium]